MRISKSDMVNVINSALKSVYHVVSHSNRNISFNLRYQKDMPKPGPIDIDALFDIAGTGGKLRYIASVTELDNGNLQIYAQLIQSLQYVGGSFGVLAKQLNETLPDRDGRMFFEDDGLIGYGYANILSEHRRYDVDTFKVDICGTLNEHLAYGCLPTKVTPNVDKKATWPIQINLEVPANELKQQVDIELVGKIMKGIS